MPVDAMHSLIERQKKNKKVFCMTQYEDILHNARRSNPYTVHRLLFEDFVDLKSVASDTLKPQLTDEHGEKMAWLKVKCLKFKSDEVGIMLYKYSHEVGTPYSVMNKNFWLIPS